MITNPTANPSKGEIIIGTTTFQRSPLPSHQWTAEGWDQMIPPQVPRAAASALPQSPPIKAWLELLGMAKYQVVSCHKIAPINEQIKATEPINATSTKPEAMVLATAVPANAPIRLVTTARSTACLGVSTLVDTTGAMALAVSFMPFMYSNMRATKM